LVFFLFFFNDTATTEIYTLSLHDALPISFTGITGTQGPTRWRGDGSSRCRERKSTRLNSSHMSISYAVFCLKKKTRRDRQQSVRVPARSGPPQRRAQGGSLLGLRGARGFRFFFEASAPPITPPPLTRPPRCW